MRRTVVCWIALVVPCELAGPTAAATCPNPSLCDVSAHYEYNVSVFDNQFRTGPVTGFSDSGTIDDPTALVSAIVRPATYFDASGFIEYHTIAQFGQLSVGVSAGANTTHSTNFNRSVSSLAQVRATATVDDTLTWKVGEPGDPNNQHINATMLLRLSGGLSAKADGEYTATYPVSVINSDFIDADAEATVKVSGRGVAPPGSPYPNGTAGYYHDQINSSNTFNEHVTLDPVKGFYVTLNDVTPYEPKNIFYMLEVFASASLQDWDLDNKKPGAANASGNFMHTLTYEGITSVTDAATGEPIANWSVTSASGFDWAHPFEVPEPCSLVSMMTVAFLFGPVYKRRTSRHWS